MPYNSRFSLIPLNGRANPSAALRLPPIPSARAGEWVIVSRGSSARFAIDKDAPLDLVIVGIVDHVNAGKAAIYRKNQGE
ncbi:MAG: EutN/CcmL family microcompartment protein [Bilophila wadsworthia]